MHPLNKSASIRISDSVKCSSTKDIPLKVNGNVNVSGKLTSNTLETKDFADFGTSYKDKTAYLAFYKGNKVGGTTHFNYNNQGKNYFRGPLNQFQEDVRLRKYNSLRVYGGCGMGGDKRLHWGCNAKHAFS